MSVLLPLAKSHEALGDALGAEASRCDRGPTGQLLQHMADAHHAAASALRDSAKREAGEGAGG